tara:strand:- start:178 stop:405 length:228 start_codon:yes stop_codon:yes gene_type:complete
LLVCALLVWTIFPFENIEDSSSKRITYLTEIECKNTIKNNNYCILIDKRNDFTLHEWKKDNCIRSEHKWAGKKLR